jgi:hypothetical protein
MRRVNDGRLQGSLAVSAFARRGDHRRRSRPQRARSGGEMPRVRVDVRTILNLARLEA